MKIKLTLLTVITLLIALLGCNEEERINVENVKKTDIIDICELNYDWLQEIDSEIASDIRSHLLWLNDAQTKAVGYPSGVTGVELYQTDSYINPEGQNDFMIYVNGIPGTEVYLRFALWGHTYTNDVIFYESTPQIIASTSSTTFTGYSPIPAYYWWENDRRIIALQISTGGVWYELGFFYQNPILPFEKFSSDLYETYEGVLPREGGDISISLPGGLYRLPQGMEDKLHFRILSGTNTIDSVYVEGASLMSNRTLTFTVPELVNAIDPMFFNIQWKYELAGNDLISISSNTYLADWGWIDWETGFQQNETFHSVVSEGRINDRISAHKDTIRLYLKKGENSANISQINFRAQSTYHLYHNRANDPLGIITDSVEGVDSLIAIGATTYDGYADIVIPAVTEENGWAYWMTTYYNYYHIGSYITAMAKWDFQYYNGSEWIDLTYQYQVPYFISPAYDKYNSNFNAGGGTIVLGIAGWWEPGTVKFSAASYDRSIIYSDEVEPSMSYGENRGGEVVLNLSGNGGITRQIYLFYTIDGGNTWTRWDTTNPSPSNWKLPETYPLIQ